MTEFAVVAPFIVVMLMGMLEFGRVLMVQQALTSAAREAAREATLPSATDNSVANVAEQFVSHLPTGAMNVEISFPTDIVNPTLADAEPGDMIIDGGNAHPADSERRSEELTAKGFRCEPAEDLVSARHQLAEHGPFDLVLLDVTLPGEDGWGLVESMRAQDDQTPVIFIVFGHHSQGFAHLGDDLIDEGAVRDVAMA